MQAVLGVIFHFIGGFASGSFYIPYKKVKGWAWESYWIVGGIFSWLLAPLVAAYLTVPDFMGIIANASSETVFWTYLMGLLWGIGGLTFGLGLRYLGVSLGMSFMLGFSSAFGALVPPIYRDIVGSDKGETFTGMLQTTGGLVVLAGIMICLIGIAVCGKAGTMKEKDLTTEQKEVGVKEFDLKKGFTVGVISGILSACFNYGIEAGKPLAEVAVQTGGNPLFQNNVTFVVILWGGLTTNFIWCMILNARNKTFGDYTKKNTPLLRNYVFSALAGITWFMQFFFYGMGESKLGNGASSWILHMAFIILISNMWGMILGEWKGVQRKTFQTIVAGVAIIMTSIVVVGIGNSL
ncbi:sugar:proton symporter [Rufibacter radiotolerans]|uniref:Sugar:proton symporter n=1 Tax=Rufibacter radiotolerans TaxID=1379910 RepID=A0A0H4VPZ8_9BACT|nr:L-rhamnose/proton symporter RhaT [Rufibacter radiotolerans]AKQ46007.1 sugar:proton symporter [Rufibacter radiotolerans]